MSDLFRLRICFAKTGRLRWLSHLELTRAMERAIRRSGLPYAVSQGFNRHMRFASGPALPVGTIGERELFDVWLNAYIPAAEALALLRLVSPDIPILDLAYVSNKLKGLQATHVLAHYQVVFKAKQAQLDDVRRLVGTVLSTGTLEVVHKGKPKRFDLAQTVVEPPEFTAEPADGAGEYRMNCVLKMGEQGTLRPEQLLLQALGEDAEVLSVARTALAEPT